MHRANKVEQSKIKECTGDYEEEEPEPLDATKFGKATAVGCLLIDHVLEDGENKVSSSHVLLLHKVIAQAVPAAARAVSEQIESFGDSRNLQNRADDRNSLIFG
jgi:hypothetical protein